MDLEGQSVPWRLVDPADRLRLSLLLHPAALSALSLLSALCHPCRPLDLVARSVLPVPVRRLRRPALVRPWRQSFRSHPEVPEDPARPRRRYLRCRLSVRLDPGGLSARERSSPSQRVPSVPCRPELPAALLDLSPRYHLSAPADLPDPVNPVRLGLPWRRSVLSGQGSNCRRQANLYRPCRPSVLVVLVVLVALPAPLARSPHQQRKHGAERTLLTPRQGTRTSSGRSRLRRNRSGRQPCRPISMQTATLADAS